jgi:hypothetical protein
MTVFGGTSQQIISILILCQQSSDGFIATTFIESVLLRSATKQERERREVSRSRESVREAEKNYCDGGTNPKHGHSSNVNGPTCPPPSSPAPAPLNNSHSSSVNRPACPPFLCACPFPAHQAQTQRSNRSTHTTTTNTHSTHTTTTTVYSRHRWGKKNWNGEL